MADTVLPGGHTPLPQPAGNGREHPAYPPLIPAYAADIAAPRQAPMSAPRLRRATLAHMAPAVIHELRQPLTAILSGAAACERVLSEEVPARESLAAGLALIRRSAERAVATMHSLQQLLGEGSLRRQRLDLADAVVETAAQFEGRAGELGVTLQHLPPARPMCVDGDGVLLRQVLVNLVDNAIHAARAAAGEPTVQLRAAGADHGCLRVTVADSGPGVAPPYVSQLFQPFATSKSTGMGIGLWLARTIAEAHDGTISVGRDPALGGAAFHLVLPAAGD